jgi:VWA domain-containing protein
VHLTFLTPVGAVLVAAAVLPLAALALNERQARRARRALRLDGPPLRSRVATAVLLALVPILLGIALAQPVLHSSRTVRVRKDAQVFYVFDTSESMRAAEVPRQPNRLARALAFAQRMHAALRDVPSGVASMTDRVLPNIFPTSSEQVFAAALADTIGIDRPPAKGFGSTATTFAALDTFAGTTFFSEGIAHRVVVLFTDGETAPYFAGDLHEALRPAPHTRFVIVRFWHADERIFAGRKATQGYRPDPRSAQETRSLANVVGGHAYSEGDVGGAIAGARQFVGRGPSADVGVGVHVVALARWFALAALVPLLALLSRRNLV